MPLEPSSAFPLKNNNTATAATKMAKILYSAFKNDIAPSAMCFAIVVIFGEPASCLVIQRFLKNTNRRPKTPKAGRNFTNNSILIH